uniref:Uncharacterized protein n=1 Tax=Oncorhynchus mykiss TaxID=8022 RepID=A0A8K9UWD4_ONCMY
MNVYVYELLLAVLQAIKNKVHPIVIDNTNLQKWEMWPYVRMVPTRIEELNMCVFVTILVETANPPSPHKDSKTRKFSHMGTFPHVPIRTLAILGLGLG